MGHGTVRASSGGPQHGCVPGCVCDSPPKPLRWALVVTSEDFQTQMPQRTLIPRVVPGKHHHASAGGCILDCTVVLEPGEERHQPPCTPCHPLRPPAVPSPCPTRQIPWLPMDLLALALLLGKRWPRGHRACPQCWELSWFRDPRLGGGCWAAEVVAVAMLPGWQRPWPDCHKTQRGIQAALSPAGISKRLTWLPTPPGTSRHPGAARAPRSTGSPASHSPRCLSCSRGRGAAASTFPDHGASCCITGSGCRDGTAWDGWGWGGCMGERGVPRSPSAAPRPCPRALCSGGTGGRGLAGA